MFDSYRAIVVDGAYMPLGMPSSGDLLSEDEVDAIRAYVLSRRNALLEAE